MCSKIQSSKIQNPLSYFTNCELLILQYKAPTPKVISNLRSISHLSIRTSLGLALPPPPFLQHPNSGPAAVQRWRPVARVILQTVLSPVVNSTIPKDPDPTPYSPPSEVCHKLPDVLCDLPGHLELLPESLKRQEICSDSRNQSCGCFL
jgi:hypothetical protein